MAEDANREMILTKIRGFIAFSKLAMMDANLLLERVDSDQTLLEQIRELLNRPGADVEIAHALHLSEMRMKALAFTCSAEGERRAVCKVVSSHPDLE